MGLRIESIIFIAAFGLGCVAAWSITSGHYERKADKLAAQQFKAEEKRNAEIAGLSTYWQKLLDDANSVEPVTVTERVYVRVKECAVPAAPVDGVADGASAARAEIDAGVVQGLERVARQAEQQYRECSHRLRSVQESLNQ